MEYEIKYEPVIINNKTIDKYNIYYYGGEFDGLKEFHSLDGVDIQEKRRLNYNLKTK